MGVDLRLLPIDHFSVTNGRAFGFSHTVLSLARNRELWGAIDADVPMSELPENHNITSYVGGTVPDGSARGETYYGLLTSDAYDQPYTWAKAGDLAPVLAKHQPAAPTTAFIAALAPDTLVVLDWH